MKVVVAGGTGLIGQALVTSLSTDGHDVVVLSRSPGENEGLLPANISMVKWDSESVGPWAAEVNGAAAVINLAGESIAGEGFLPARWTESKKGRIRQSRLKAGQALNEAVRQADRRPRVFVQSSAVGYYGARGNEEVTEETPAGNDFLATVCIDWEESTRAVEQLGVRRVVLRIGLVLSTAGGALPRLLLPFKLFGGGYFGDGRQVWPWVHMADVVRAVRFVIDNETVHGPVNLTAPNPVANRVFGQALGHALSRPALLPVPASAMRLALGEVADTVLTGQRAVPRKLDDLGFRFAYVDVQDALTDLVNNRAGQPASELHASAAPSTTGRAKIADSPSVSNAVKEMDYA